MVLPTVMWTIEEAVDFVRLHKGKALDHGFVLFIGGGVIQNGSSERNLDLVALSRDRDSQVGAIDFIFNGMTRIKESVAGNGRLYIMSDTFGRVVSLLVLL